MLMPFEHLGVHRQRTSDPRLQLCVIFIRITRIRVNEDTVVRRK